MGSAVVGLLRNGKPECPEIDGRISLNSDNFKTGRGPNGTADDGAGNYSQSGSFHSPRRFALPLCHRFLCPDSRFIAMAQSARVRNTVLVCHFGRDEAERVCMNHCSGHTFSFSRRHMASDAVAARASGLMMRVCFNRGGVWPIGRHGTMTVQANLVRRLD